MLYFNAISQIKDKNGRYKKGITVKTTSLDFIKKTVSMQDKINHEV